MSTVNWDDLINLVLIAAILGVMLLCCSWVIATPLVQNLVRRAEKVYMLPTPTATPPPTATYTHAELVIAIEGQLAQQAIIEGVPTTVDVAVSTALARNDKLHEESAEREEHADNRATAVMLFSLLVVGLVALRATGRK